MDYCANCETEAVTFITVTSSEGRRRRRSGLYLCQSCKNAFEWGYAHGEDGDRLEEKALDPVSI